MKNSKSLLLAVSTNAEMSKWMPWELGFVDGNTGRCAIVPVSKDNLTTYSFRRVEYLKLYPYITRALQEGTNLYKLWVYEETDTYIIFNSWLRGENPFKRI